MIRKLLITLLLLVPGRIVFAQEGPQYSGMEALFRGEGKIYVVVGVLVIIFLGILIYLIMTDRRIGKLEQRENEQS